MVILGPKNLPFVKLFRNTKPKDLVRFYAHYNHCETVCHEAIWLQSRDCADRVIAGLEKYFSDNSHHEAFNNHYEYNYDDFEMQVTLDSVFRDAGITWAMSDEEREEHLTNEANKLYQKKIRKERAALGVVIDE